MLSPASPALSNLSLALQIENARAGELDSLAHQLTSDFATARRGLEGAKVCLTQTPGPEGRQHAMRSAGYGIFRDALGGREVAAYEIVTSVSRRGHDHAGTIQTRERQHIRS